MGLVDEVRRHLCTDPLIEVHGGQGEDRQKEK